MMMDDTSKLSYQLHHPPSCRHQQMMTNHTTIKNKTNTKMNRASCTTTSAADDGLLRGEFVHENDQRIEEEKLQQVSFHSFVYRLCSGGGRRRRGRIPTSSCGSNSSSATDTNNPQQQQQQQPYSMGSYKNNDSNDSSIVKPPQPPTDDNDNDTMLIGRDRKQQRQQQCVKLILIPSLLLLLITATVIAVQLLLFPQQPVSSLFQSSSYFSAVSTTTNTIRIAFIGNSITFVNDLPRLMESLSVIQNNQNHTATVSTIQQNSCLHSSLSFVSILSKGNGMYNKWKTSNAVIIIDSDDDDDDTATTDANTTSSRRFVYDFGACTVRQLLFGYDKYLYQDNSNQHYVDDGMNPCFASDTTAAAQEETMSTSSYYEYLTENLLYDYNPNHFQSNTSSYSNSSGTNVRQRMRWDYIIMNDQTVQPGIPQRRKRSIRALRRIYAKLFNRTKSSARPIFLSTYGYDKSLYEDNDDDDDDNNNDPTSNYDLNDDDNVDNANDANTNVDDDATYVVDADESSSNTNDGEGSSSSSSSTSSVYDTLGDIAEFTSRIWYGYQLYSEALGKLLPSSQQPIVVPSALAFLLIHEENYNAWLQLFYDDGFHPSPHGTYLLGCCLYATIYQHMPLPPTSLVSSSSSTGNGWLSWFRNLIGNNHNKQMNNTAPIEALYKNARLMHTESMGNDRPYPTVQEAMYLYNIAERVVLKKHIPVSLLSYETIAQLEADELNN